MEEYVVIQNFLLINEPQNQTVSNIVRVFMAIDEEQAIGKFILSTKNFYSNHQKFVPECYKISYLKEISEKFV